MSEKLSAVTAAYALELAAVVFILESVYDIPEDVMMRVEALREKMTSKMGNVEASAEDLLNFLFEKYGV